MKILGIDYGSKNVGVAISDDDCNLAFPKTVVKNSKDLAENVKAICENENISAIVVGESTNSKGEPNIIMKKITPFVAELETKTGLAVHLEPEFMTTEQARRFQGQIKEIDASAAAIILQSYLDKENNKN